MTETRVDIGVEAGDVASLLAPLRHLALVARRIDMTPFEEESAEVVEREVRPVVARLLEVAIGALHALAGASASTAPPAPAEVDLDDDDWFGEERVDPAPATAGPVASEDDLPDIIALARMQLAQQLANLRNPVEEHDLWLMLAECNQCCGALIQAAVSIEAALCARHDLVPELRSPADLEPALRVRAAYRTLRRSVRAKTNAANPEVDIEPRLQASEKAIRSLIGSSVYRSMRASDRCQLRRLYERLVSWKSSDGRRDMLEGRHLLQDLEGLVEMMMQINNREDLITHDRTLLLEIIGRLFGDESSSTALESQYRERLVRLWGRDRELDPLIERRAALGSIEFLKAALKAALRLGLVETGRAILDAGDSCCETA